MFKKLKISKLLSLIILLLFFILNFSFLVQGYNLNVLEEPTEMPINEDFLNYFENPPDVNYGYIPPPIDLSYLNKLEKPKNYTPKSLPSVFDWRSLNGVTSVKDQDGCGTCWVFGTTSVLESKVKINEGIDYDFSEQNVASCVDRSWTYLYDNSDDPCNGGGWSWLASEVFIRKGAVLETCDPYNPSALKTDGSCVCKNCPQIKRVNGYRIVTYDGSQIDLIKQAIYNYGPVTMAYYHNSNYLYYHPTYGYIYDCNNCSYPNHIVSIVGWNDNVPHWNTPGTGAWIVKNSWGPWGNNGYFYLAYNSSCMEEITYLLYENSSNKELYLWDEAGWVTSLGYGDNSAWMAAVYEAKSYGKLTNVEFWVTSSNASYQLYIYDGFFGNNLLSSKTGTLNEAGYYSIPLDNPINLNKNQQFTIQVKLTTPGYNYPIPVERYISGWIYSPNPPIQTNKTFIRHNDTDMWSDASNGGRNVCLRALVEPTSPSVRVNFPNGGESFNVNQEVDISWDEIYLTEGLIKILFFDGNSWSEIASDIPLNTKTYKWTTPNIKSTNCKIKVINYSGSNEIASDESDNYFTIKSKLNIAILGQPNSLFPIFESNNINTIIYETIIEPLVGITPEGKTYPCLLEKIPDTDDGSIQIDNENNRMIVTYKLRDNLYWSDGEPITSHDFYFTWQMMNNSEINVLSRTPFDLIYQVDTPNDKTFVTYWNTIDILYAFNLSIYPSHILEPIYNNNPKDIETCEYNRNPIHAGPYKLLEWNDNSIVVVPNNYYYGDQPQIDEVVFRFYNDVEQIKTDILNGQVDLVWGILGIDDINYLKNNGADENYNIFSIDSLFWEHLTCNMDDPIIGDSNDPNLRKALNLAINKQEIINTIYGGYRNVSNNFLIQKDSVYYNPNIEDFQYNPTLARNILQNAGYYWDNEGKLHKPNGDLVSITIKTTTRVDRGQAAQMICNYWSNNLGVNANYLQINPVDMFSTVLPHRDFQVALFAWGGEPLYKTYTIYTSDQIPTPENNYNGQNYGGFINHQLDELNGQLCKISYPKNFHLLSQMQLILFEKMPDIPLYYWSDFLVYKKNLNGINFNMSIYHPQVSYPPITWNIEKWYIGEENSLSITTESNLPNSFVNKPYLKFLDSSGGSGFYKYQLLSGNLPPGLILNQSGTIYGVPNTRGTYNFIVQVTDRDGNTTTKSFNINVYILSITILSPTSSSTWQSLFTYQVGWSYSGDTSGIDKVKIWYSPDNGTTWRYITQISGSSITTYNWYIPYDSSLTYPLNAKMKIYATNSSGVKIAETITDTFTINPPLTFTFIHPVSTDIWQTDSLQKIEWSTLGDRSQVNQIKMWFRYSKDNGATWSNWIWLKMYDRDRYGNLVDTINYYWWKVLYSYESLFSDSDYPIKLQIRIYAVDSSGRYVVPEVLLSSQITTQSPLKINVTSPNGGEYLKQGTTYNITWTISGYTGFIQNIKIKYSIDNGATWTFITSLPPTSTSYSWRVPSVNSTNCLIKVYATDSNGNYLAEDNSNRVFTIGP